MKNAQEHIKEVFNRGAQNDFYADMAMGAIDVAIHTVFANSNKFIYEIIQNADDCHAKEVNFFLRDSNLQVTHDGDKFTETDVERLCRYVASAEADEESKTHDLKKTGYKGVGFKAVFCVSKNVTILSGEYRFSFDKSYWEKPERKQSSKHRYPWPIIPIWNLEKENEVYQVLSNFRNQKIERPPVCFLLQGVDALKLQEEFNEVFKSLELLLSLRSVKKLTFYDEINSKVYSILAEVKAIDPGGQDISLEEHDFITVLSYYVDQQFRGQRSWYKQSFEIHVDENIRAQLEMLNAHACPEKIKKADIVTVTFAAQINESGVTPCEVSPTVYCYLPTKIDTKLPFLVNADFLLNQDRKELLENVWNSFLLEKIGEYQFHWFSKIVEAEHYQKTVLNLLAPPQILGVPKKLNYAYKEGFEKGFNEVPFILSLSGHIIKARDCVIDNTGFFLNFYPKIIDQNLQLSNECSRIISGQLKDIQVLEDWFEKNNNDNLKIKIDMYSREHLLERLSGYLLSHENYEEIIIPVLEFFMEHGNVLTPELLRSQKILITEKQKKLGDKKNLYSMNECFISNGDRLLTQNFEINILHNIFSDNNEIKNWLIQIMKMRSFIALDLIEGYILPLIEQGHVKSHNTLNLLAFIYDAIYIYKEKISDELYDKLQFFPVFYGEVTNKVKPINECFISKFYSGQDYGVPVDELVSEEYYKIRKNKKNWESLFTQLKVKSKITLTQLKEVEQLKLTQNDKIEFDDYYYFLTKTRKIDHFKNNRSEKHIFKNFTYFKFFNKITEDVYYRLFWRTLKQKWYKIEEESFFNKATAKSEDVSIPHYIPFYLKNYECTRVLNTLDFKKSTEIYFIPKEYSELPFKIADIPSDVTLEEGQAKLLGYRTEVEPKICLKKLNKFSSKKKVSPQMIQKFYELLLKAKVKDEDIKDLVEREFSGIKLLTSDGVTAQREGLFWFDAVGTPTRNKRFFHPIGLSEDQIRRLVSIFGLSGITGEAQKYTRCLEEGSAAWEKAAELKREISVYLLYLAIQEARKMGKEPRAYIEQVFGKFKSLSIQYCSDIKHDMTEEVISVLIQGDVLFLLSSKTKRNLFPEITKRLSEFFLFSSSIQAEFQRIFPSEEPRRNGFYFEKLNSEDTEIFDEFSKIFKTLINEKGIKEVTEKMSTLVISNPETPKSYIRTQQTSPIKEGCKSSTLELSDEEDANEEDSDSEGINLDNSEKRIKSPVNSSGIFSQNFIKNNEKQTLNKNEEIYGLVNSKSSSSFFTKPQLSAKERKPHNKEHANFTKSTGNSSTPKSKLTPEQATLIGRHGEQIVYDRLKKHYEKKYLSPGKKAEDNKEKNGFFIKFEVKSNNENNSSVIKPKYCELEIIWRNKELGHLDDYRDSFDIKIIKKLFDENGEEFNRSIRYVEVKTTPSEKIKNKPMFFSANEWALMHEQKEKYSIFRVFGVKHDHDRDSNKNEVEVEKIKNPAQLLEENRLEVTAAQIRY